jgi:hypothetical protein
MRQLGTFRKTVIALTVGGLLTTACGLKPEVKESLRQGGTGLAPGQSRDAAGNIVDESGNIVVPATEATAGTGGTGTGGTGTGGTGGTGSGGTGGTGGTGGGTVTNPTAGPTTGTAGDTTGIRGGKIYLALHGPLTGAGVPQDSFKTGTQLYWKTHKIRGMEVVADAFDDEYNPGGAIKACRRAAPNYFLVVGGAGTDQIQACAKDQVMQRGGVPYISAGVTTNGLTGLPNYFAASLTYAQQGPTVVKMAKERDFFTAAHGWALVISDTPNFADARDSIQNALKAAGMKFTYIPVPKVGGNSTTVANQLRAGQYETVFFLGQPLFFTEVVGKTGCNITYCPDYTGVGISMGVNTVANLACAGSGGGFLGHFLSPYPGFSDASKYAPGVTFKDDIEFTIYGMSQALDQMFQSIPASLPLTRQNFIATVAKNDYKGGIFNPAKFSSGTHFGGTTAYYLRADCNKRQWVTDGGPTR